MTQSDILYHHFNRVPITLSHGCMTENGFEKDEIFTIKEVIGDFEQVVIINQYNQKATINPNQIEDTIPAVSIEVEDDYTYTQCPRCENMEQFHVDEQRHHMGHFNILEWLPDHDDSPEISLMECLGCKTHFHLVWDYENEVNV